MLAENLTELFNRKRSRVGTSVGGCCIPLNNRECLGDRERVSSNKIKHYKRVSYIKPSILVSHHEESKKPNIFPKQGMGKQFNKIVKPEYDFSLQSEKSWIPAKSKRGGKQKRPGLIRAEPIALGRAPVSLQEEKEDKIEGNLLDRAFVLSSSEFYDDRSPVSGAWTSDSSSNNSCVRLGLAKLGSSESDRDYGGEEGAKPFGTVDKDDSISPVNSCSEGQPEEWNKRPQWFSDNDSVPEKNIFPSSSLSAVHLQLAKQSSSDEKENSVHILVPSKEEVEGHNDIPLSQEFEVPIISRKNVIVI